MTEVSELNHEREYIRDNLHRARWLFGITLGVLFASMMAYFVLHFWIFGGRSLNMPLVWYQVVASSPMSQRSIDWVLWSMFGTTIFILTEIVKYYPQMETLGKKGALTGNYEATFVKFTPWYIMTFLRGPFLSLIILMFFNTANFNLTGTGSTDAFTFKFSELDHRATLLLAFVLGYYHRVARQVLDDIVASVFSSAWGKVYEIKIEPEAATVVLGESMVFKTNPSAEVTWTASLGTIDVNGKYTAPSEVANLGSSVVIAALPRGKKWMIKPATVTLVPFVIQGPNTIDLKDTETQTTYSVRPAQNAVKWKITPDSGGGSIDDQGVYSAPIKTPQIPDRVTLTATAMIGTVSCSAQIEVKLVK